MGADAITTILAGIQQYGTFILAMGTFAMAYLTYKTLQEHRKDRMIRLIEKRLEEFYLPLITFFGNGSVNGLKKEDWEKVSTIIIGKRYLCEPETARIIPYNFNGNELNLRSGIIYFMDDSYYNKWVELANKIWEDHIKYQKDYCKLTGSNYRNIEDKPHWYGLKLYREAYPRG